MGNGVHFIPFLKPTQNRAKCGRSNLVPYGFNPNPNKDEKVNFLVVILSLSYSLYLVKQNDNVILCLSKHLLQKLANVKVSESMLTYKPK